MFYFYYVCIFPHHVGLHWDITFQTLITDSLWVGLITPCNLSGRSLISRFLSEPIRLVKSCTPLPFPSAFLFSQTLKDTPHSWIHSTTSDKCLLFLSFGGLLPLSLKSHSRASLTKLFVRISEILENQNEMWWSGIHRVTWSTLPTHGTSPYLYSSYNR